MTLARKNPRSKMCLDKTEVIKEMPSLKLLLEESLAMNISIR